MLRKVSIWMAALAMLICMVPMAMAAGEVEGVYVLKVDAEMTAANSMHGGLLHEYPCETVNTLTLRKDGSYTWQKVLTSIDETAQVRCEYTFEGTYEPGNPSKLKLNPAEKCSFFESYGDFIGASPIGSIQDRSGDETTNPECLEYFNTCYIVWSGNTGAKVKLDSKKHSFEMKDHNDEWSYIWSGDMEPRIARYVAETYEMRPLGEIVYYGASNFRLWLNMEEDMAPYAVQNHGVGGSIDLELIEFADVLLYPFQPSVVFIQTGSNDYTGNATLEECLANKERMYALFAENLPDTKFMIMAGLPLPKRSQYWELTQQVNNWIADYCAEHENFYFVDGTDSMLTDSGDAAMQTGDGRYFNPAIFKSDGIHLTQEGHDLWTPYMTAALAEAGFPSKS